MLCLSYQLQLLKIYHLREVMFTSMRAAWFEDAGNDREMNQSGNKHLFKYHAKSSHTANAQSF